MHTEIDPIISPNPLMGWSLFRRFLFLLLIQMIQRPELAEETQFSSLCYQIIAGIQLSDELSTQVMCAVSVTRGGSEENSALYIVDNNMKLRAAAAPATHRDTEPSGGITPDKCGH